MAWLRKNPDTLRTKEGRELMRLCEPIVRNNVFSSVMIFGEWKATKKKSLSEVEK
jgi:hypothetical protein